jgi:GNAT superfamily N-acetyltransferase
MNVHTADEPVQLALHRERPIPPAALRGLYDHVGWDHPTSETELTTVLAAGPAVAAWVGEELIGFVRALSDGHRVAYIEDVMVHAKYRRRGLGSALMARLLDELETVKVVTLFCHPDLIHFYERQGFRSATNVLMHRKRRDEQ